MKKILFLIIVLFLSLPFAAQENSDGVITRIKSNLEFLASDAMRGREAGSEFEDISAEFIISEFKKYGIGKFKNDSSFLQKIPVTISKINNDSEVKIFDEDGHETILEMDCPDRRWARSRAIDLPGIFLGLLPPRGECEARILFLQSLIQKWHMENTR